MLLQPSVGFARWPLTSELSVDNASLGPFTLVLGFAGSAWVRLLVGVGAQFREWCFWFCSRLPQIGLTFALSSLTGALWLLVPISTFALASTRTLGFWFALSRLRV